jgi:hypothetical protein
MCERAAGFDTADGDRVLSWCGLAGRSSARGPTRVVATVSSRSTLRNDEAFL